MRQAFALLVISLTAAAAPAFGAAGSEAASFLDIPVGGRAAALGAGYTALAADSYAPIWNPAGLGFVRMAEFSGMHLNYLENVSYDYASFVHRLSKDLSAAGIAVQYLRPGNIQSTDINGAPMGDFTGHYAAYSAAYGRKFGKKVALGLSGKLIDARISDVSARAYGFDAGVMCQAASRLRIGAVVSGLGSKLTFIDRRDTVTSAFRLGAAYVPVKTLNFTLEEIFPFSRTPPSGHAGVEWNPLSFISFRGGYRSDTVKGLSAVAGISTGIGIHLLGQDFDYAWLPLGDLGAAQYLSFSIHFGIDRSDGRL